MFVDNIFLYDLDANSMKVKLSRKDLIHEILLKKTSSSQRPTQLTINVDKYYAWKMFCIRDKWS